MADSSIDLAVIKRTQDALGKYIKKPPLTEKLLQKPPFRFLYDVFNTVIKENGCFDGLYTVEEQNIDNIKDRDDKMKYLQKMIDVIKITTNRAVKVRASKIVAGQEPEQTNELLQLLAEVIENELDWHSAVDVVVNRKTSSTQPHKSERVEKPKEKDVKSREKSKDLRKEVKISAGKTISPRSKEKKILKNKTTSSKENTVANKVEPKPTKEKKTIETKERISRNLRKDALEKLNKITKISKTVSKEGKTSTPDELIKSRPETKIKTNNEQRVERNKTKEENTRIPLKNIVAETTNEERENEGVSSNLTKETTPPSDEPIPSSPLRAVERREDLQNIASEAAGNNESTKKSPKTRSRKSSSNNSDATETRNDENDNNNRTPLNHVESLNNEEQTAQTTLHSADPPQTSLEEQERKTSPNISDIYTQNVKRETTFTRENSIESNNNRNNPPRSTLRPPSARPPSARPGAPRRRDRNVEIILQPNEPIKMSDISVKLETFGDFDDDGENLVILESPIIGDESFGQHQGSKSAAENGVDSSLEQRGHLVQQILETQKELVHQNSDVAGKQEKDSELSSAINTRQSSAPQMNNLRDIIQKLTKSVNPFGKLMDFIPEDIDAMQLELTMWRDSYAQTISELNKEKSLTESITEPMKNQLIQIEANLLEYQEIIDVTRTKILQNSEKILKMLTEP